MLKKRRKTVWLITLILMISSCIETDLTLNEYTSEIVIDGSIEPGRQARVHLTKSAPFFGETDSISIRNYVITRAKVTLSTTDEEEILTLKPNQDYFPPYVYVSTRMIGETGKTYFLTVEFEGKKVFAHTTIPSPVFLDEIYFQKVENQDSLGYINIRFRDQVETEDYYFSMTQVINKDYRFKPTLVPDFSDKSLNGRDIELSLLQGGDTPAWIDEDVYFTVGDTIFLKFCTIDKDSYDFWSSFLKEIKNTSNPFSSTNSHVKSNVTNGLGVWSGYGATYYQVIAR